MDNVTCMAKDDGSGSVSSGLNLWLPLEDTEKMGELLEKLLEEQDAITVALTELHYVHFARFVPTPCSTALQVITSFDGEFDAYVMDFVLAIGEQFEMILGYVKGRPPSPVKDHPGEFLDFICRHNLSYDAEGGGGIGMYSAYADRTVIDIVGARGISAAFVDPPPVAIDRNDVQANILRGVSSKFSWYAGLRFQAVGGARTFLRELLSGGAGVPQVTSDTPWSPVVGRPDYVLTLGFTYSGLLALGIEEHDQRAFCLSHKAYVRGPGNIVAARANGDVGESRPAFWEFGGADPIDLVVMIHSDDKKNLFTATKAIRDLANRESLVLVAEKQAEALIDPKHPSRRGVHFGYADGLSHPRLSSTDAPAHLPDKQPKANVGEFLLGANFPNIYGGLNSLGGISTNLGQNGTFAALRILEQDVAGFEAMLDTESTKHGVDKEWLAAKLMGRWRDGTPVSLYPDSPSKDPESATLNNFNFLASGNHKDVVNDATGALCPIGAHVRRMNPRSAIVAGRPYSRRLLRRGMPYGPDFDPHNPEDGQKRGLVGLFVCADLDRQYEFILRHWANGDRATTGLLGQQDPIIGAQESLHRRQSIKAEFRIPRPGGADIVLTLPRFIKTVGSAYLFMPGLSGLKYLAKDNGREAVPFFRTASSSLHLDHLLIASTETLTTALNPATFDPRDTTFRAGPFKAYRLLREQRPVVRLPLMNSTWVLSYQHVMEAAQSLDKFGKRKSDDKANAGLLNMDPPAHTQCRAEVEPLFEGVLTAVKPVLPGLIAEAYALCQGQGQNRALDWMELFAKPVAQGAFFELLGLKRETCIDLVDLIEVILQLGTPAEDEAQRKQFSAKTKDAAIHLYMKHRKLAVSDRLYDAIQQMTGPHDPVHNTKLPGIDAVVVEQTVNTVTMAMAGFLPLQWFIAIATWRLLQDGGTLLKQLKTDTLITNRDVVDELLRFDMSAPLSDRYVIHDNTVLGGVTLNKDDRVTLSFASANHDPAEFGADADEINFKRSRKGPGLAFGYSNEHSCLGKDMVYAVMEPVIQILRDANPILRLETGFKPSWGMFAEGAMFRSMAALKVHC